MDNCNPIVPEPIVMDLSSDLPCITVPTGDVSDADSVTSLDPTADDSLSRDDDTEPCDDVYIDDINNGDFRVVTEYRAILSHFHDLPRDMFVAQIVRDYASSEPDLERVRNVYFEHLKDTHECFPYSESDVLKRRMFTRSGEPVAVRLAQDIHSILQVVEGGDPAILRQMISVGSGKARRTTSVSSGLARRKSMATPRRNTELPTCACASEVKLLKDTVATLQSNVLLMKQDLALGEKLRSDFIDTSKSAALDIKRVVLECARSVSDSSVSTLQAMRNISHSLVQRITEFEDRVRLLETLVQARDTPETPSMTHGQADFKCTRIASPPIDDACHHFTPSPNSSHEPLPVHDHYDTDEASRAHGTRTAVISRDTLVKGIAIPVRVTRRTGHHVDADGDNEDFTPYTRKRTKHYCVLGLNRTLNVDLLKKVITSKGPSVSSMRVYPSRRNSSKVILRLNLTDDELCDRVLDEGFWPSFVTCKR